MRSDRRADATRFNVSLTVRGRVPATPIEAKLLNISLTGCMIETAVGAHIAPSATIVLSLSEETTLSGQVAWHMGGKVGIQFHDRASEETVAQIRRESAHRNLETMTVSDSFGRELPDLARPVRSGRFGG